MTKVRMVATETFSATSVRAEPLRPDEEFEAGSEAEARELEDRGLARRHSAQGGPIASKQSGRTAKRSAR